MGRQVKTAQLFQTNRNFRENQAMKKTESKQHT